MKATLKNKGAVYGVAISGVVRLSGPVENPCDSSWGKLSVYVDRAVAVELLFTKGEDGEPTRMMPAALSWCCAAMLPTTEPHC